VHPLGRSPDGLRPSTSTKWINIIILEIDKKSTNRCAFVALLQEYLMAENKTVEIAEAKGRPMLHWVGKRPLDHVTAHPAQLVERFSPLPSNGRGAGGEGGNLLFHGDNKDVLAWLLAHGYRGKVNLVYIDPPFDSGADYVRQVQLRGIRVAKGDVTAHRLHPE
jgi:hypothetical protein